MKKILLCLCILLLATGCGQVPKLENGKEAVVSLNDNNSISVDDLYEEIKNTYAIGVLVDMIDTKVLNIKYPTTDEETEEVQGQIDTWLQTFETEEKLLEQTQQAFGISKMEDLKEYLSLQYKRGKAVEDYAKNSVTDQEIQSYYDSEVFGDIKVRHILITPETTSSMTEAEKQTKKDEALQKAKDIITRLNNGEDFATVAKEVSQDEDTKDDGGEIGFITKGDYPEAFEDAAKALETGKYTTDPVETSYGYHIILKEEQKEKAPLDQWKDKIKETLGQEKLEDDPTMQITALMELRNQFGMNIVDDSLRDQYDLLMKQTKESLIEQNSTSY